MSKPHLLVPSLLLAAAPALAQAPPSHRALVAPYQAPGAGGGSGLVAAKLSDGLKADLAGRPAQLHLIHDAQAPQAGRSDFLGAGGGGSAHLAAARNHVKVGTGLLSTGRFEDAMRELSEALALFEANLAFLNEETELVEVHLAWAAAAFQAGFEDDGEGSLRQALAMKPDLKAAGRGYPPLFERLTDKFRRRQARQKPGVLALTTDPSPATVFVDGVEVGQTPLDLDDLPQGGHYLRIVRPMYGVWAQKVPAPPEGERGELSVTLPPIGGEAAQAGDAQAADLAAQQSLAELSATLSAGVTDARLSDRAYELSLRVGATHVVCGVVKAGATAYLIQTFLLRAEPRALADLGTVTVDPELLELGVRTHEVAERVVAALDAFPEYAVVPDAGLAAPPIVAVVPPPADLEPATAPLMPLTDGPPPGAVPVALLPEAFPGTSVTAPPPEPATAMASTDAVPPPLAPEPGGTRWYRRWWVWTTVGVLVAGGAAAAGFFLLQPQETQPETFAVEWSAR